ncbi:MAG: FAD-dependent oxidoreductase [Thermoanaerobacterales bacterium]|nr:FAD-dependent oxidoreductase [Thermoanaerobacterales bacterium]
MDEQLAVIIKTAEGGVTGVTHGKTGAVLVVGAGVAGLQAALDLARAGFKVYLAEAGPAAGGRMPALGRVFPTNECSLCTLSPYLAAVARHPSVNTLTQARLIDLQGEAGQFRATLAVTPRGVDPARCKACGACAAVCPVSVPDQFNAGLSSRKAIYQPYPQAYPAAFVIDRAACTDCGRCAEACTAHAIDLERDEEERVTLDVGAVILSPGLAPFAPVALNYLGYGRYRNIITSVAFERILSAGGPSGGRLVRPSDGRAPERIAWLQCIGSRNPAIGRGYCSAVCCMAAVKAAVSAKEQASVPLETVIFFRDLRTYGKGHERYLARARSEGVQFVRAGVGGLHEQSDGSLLIRYAMEDGTVRRERFDLVVLSVGQEAAGGHRELAGAARIAADEFGFCLTTDIAGNCTSRPGVFAAGSFTGPRDIPDSVTGGSAAAAQAMALLAGNRGTLVERPVVPPERDRSEQEPRIGVVVCRCGTNIAGTVDVARVARAARELPGVVWVREEKHACAADGQAALRRAIARQGLNRVVIAACSPRTHGLLFGNVVREAGLNRYLVEMANIRDHCAWVHGDAPEAATAKACALVRGAVAKARVLEPVADVSVRLTPAALVVGAGIAGLEASFGLAEQGFEVHLVERASTLGGRARTLRYEPEGRDVRGYVAGLVSRVMEHPLVHVHLERTVSRVHGHVGRFVSVLDDGREITHGVVVLATGAVDGTTGEYLYGRHPSVYTQGAYETALSASENLKTVVFIQCVGSRREGERRPYCSRMCCGRTLALALATLERHPGARVYVLYRDLMAYGRMEEVYREARRRGVVFVRYGPDSPPAAAAAGEGVAVEVCDVVLGARLDITADALVLATGLEPAPGNREVARLFKVPVDEYGFFLEAQPMLRPVDFAAEGVFLCGDAQAPKALHESAAQGRAAAARAGALLGAGTLEARGVYAVVNPQACAACLNCIRVCPYNVPVLDGHTARIEPVACQGCGICVAGCPNQAISLTGYNSRQLTALVGALFADPKDGGET